MGLDNGARAEGEIIKSFSNDLLKIQLSGPDHDHFSVIDLPGLFRSTYRVTPKSNLGKLTRDRADSRTDYQRRYVARSQPGLHSAQE